MKQFLILFLFASSNAFAAELPTQYLGSWKSDCSVVAQGSTWRDGTTTILQDGTVKGTTRYYDNAQCAQNTNTQTDEMIMTYTVESASDTQVTLAVAYSGTIEGHAVTAKMKLDLAIQASDLKTMTVIAKDVRASIDGQEQEVPQDATPQTVHKI